MSIATCLADQDVVERVAALTRLLGDATRIRILGLLQTGPRNVSALCGDLELAQPTVSHHLAMLRTAGLVLTRREGKQIFYSLNPDHLGVLASEGGLRLSLGRVKMFLGCEDPARNTAAAAAVLN